MKGTSSLGYRLRVKVYLRLSPFVAPPLDSQPSAENDKF